MTQEAKAIFEALLEKGQLDTLALRREARMTGKESQTRFERALVELQTGLKILPVGVAEAGAWRYAFIYEPVDRYYPDLAERARPIGRSAARAHVTGLYLDGVGVAGEAEVAKLFGWKSAEVTKALMDLKRRRRARRVMAGGQEQWATAKL